MRLLTSKDGDILSYFEKIDESQIGIQAYSLIRNFFDNQEVLADRGKVKEPSPLEPNFDFCKTFKKIRKNSGFHPNLRTADLHDLFFTQP